ncbi:MAG: MFS transporter [Chromatiales bacterium]|nr:MFS transporter [Chromatiales bacterium]
MNLGALGWRSILAIATLSMLFQQAFSYVCQMVMPFLADRLADDFGISRGWLGLYLFIQNLMAIIAAVGCGGFILRYGPLRISQYALLLMGISLLITATGILWLLPLGALLLGASAVSTPASSHILARVCPARLAPLIFSVKQTGVPVGSLIGGLLIPVLLGLVFYSATFSTTIRVGTYGAAIVTALIVFVVAMMLQPIREYFDSERRPGMKLSVSDLPQTMRLVLTNYPLRDIAFSAFAFGGLQSIYSGFFILFLIDGLEYSETSAGTAFAIASFSAIWARIAWGVLGSSLVSPRVVLGGIGLIGGVAAILMTWIDHTWTIYEITAVAVLYNITALSWHGILLAETARLAPAEQVGGITGGVLSFTSVAMMIYPVMYGVVLATTGSYKIGFAIGAVPSFIAFAVFAAKPIQGPWAKVISRRVLDLFTWRGLYFVTTVVAIGGLSGIWFFVGA